MYWEMELNCPMCMALLGIGELVSPCNIQRCFCIHVYSSRWLLEEQKVKGIKATLQLTISEFGTVHVLHLVTATLSTSISAHGLRKNRTNLIGLLDQVQQRVPSLAHELITQLRQAEVIKKML